MRFEIKFIGRGRHFFKFLELWLGYHHLKSRWLWGETLLTTIKVLHHLLLQSLLVVIACLLFVSSLH